MPPGVGVPPVGANELPQPPGAYGQPPAGAYGQPPAGGSGQGAGYPQQGGYPGGPDYRPQAAAAASSSGAILAILLSAGIALVLIVLAFFVAQTGFVTSSLSAITGMFSPGAGTISPNADSGSIGGGNLLGSATNGSVPQGHPNLGGSNPSSPTSSAQWREAYDSLLSIYDDLGNLSDQIGNAKNNTGFARVEFSNGISSSSSSKIQSLLDKANNYKTDVANVRATLDELSLPPNYETQRTDLDAACDALAERVQVLIDTADYRLGHMSDTKGYQSILQPRSSNARKTWEKAYNSARPTLQ